MLVWGLGEVVVAVSACMSGTRGSGVLSSTGDVLVERCWWSVLTCVPCLASGRCGWREGG